MIEKKVWMDQLHNTISRKTAVRCIELVSKSLKKTLKTTTTYWKNDHPQLRYHLISTATQNKKTTEMKMRYCKGKKHMWTEKSIMTMLRSNSFYIYCVFTCNPTDRSIVCTTQSNSIQSSVQPPLSRMSTLPPIHNL